MELVAHRVGRLCGQAVGGQLREHAERYGVVEVLDRIVAAVRQGRVDSHLAEDLDRLDAAFARNGVDGLTTGVRGFEPWPGGGGHPTITAWTCPSPRPCPRAVPVGDGERPGCALTGAPFVETRIPL
ncbi:hypothetical protein EV384_0479 [Micromonospora kangleipakensis]|uniref:Uncharacterized protein n=1 Tax=Micromonospora kangleipakensis TaxID=1077942 RepID=A0A4Q8B3R3_9ACTN|nr:hypothetical protein [Micromonospora kangleipakensis]RZU72137.1 hypothetical protein EV384_0479 [Micromonospora kangleipakensis]